jgi:protein TonB
VRQQTTNRWFKRLLHGIWVLLGAAAMTLVFFFMLPLMQIINKPPSTDVILRPTDTALPPPPPPLEAPEPEKKPEPEDKPPALVEEAPPLDLSQLELALNPSGDGTGALGDFAIDVQVCFWNLRSRFEF